jgi:tRNA-dihydrouridine synthase B
VRVVPPRASQDGKDRQRFRRLLAAGGAVLAPMAGYTDAPFRRLAHAYGAAWAVTEMVSARALASGDRTGLAISAPYPGERDVVIQLFAADPDEAAAAAGRLVAAYAPAAIDLNMGCPVRKVRHKGCGVELLRDPSRAAAIVAAIDAAVPVPVTVKTRLGIDRVGAHEALAAVVEAGAAAVAIHGRTAHQKYAGEADWDAIAAVAAGLDVPVVGSGDVRDADAFARARARGLGVMVARGALGRPWLFRLLRGGPQPTPEEVAAVVWRHARDHVAWYGGERALPRLRGQLVAYAVEAWAALRAADGLAADGPDDAGAVEREAFHDGAAAARPRDLGDPRRGRDPLGLRDAAVRAPTLAALADAWAAATGIDPRDAAVAVHDPIRDDTGVGRAGVGFAAGFAQRPSHRRPGGSAS